VLGGLGPTGGGRPAGDLGSRPQQTPQRSDFALSKLDIPTHNSCFKQDSASHGARLM